MRIRPVTAAVIRVKIIYPGLESGRFHDLRHTAVTVLAEKGLPIK
jgi:integrase